MRGSPATSVAAFRRQFPGERVDDRLVDDEPLRRHADLTLVHESAEGGGGDRFVEVGVVEHQERRLAAELEQNRFQMTGGEFSDVTADPRRSGEVHTPHGWMGDQGLDDTGGVSRRIADDIDHAQVKTGGAKRLADEPVRARANFGPFEHHGVAASQRHRDRAHAEDHGRVPGGHAEDDADGLPQRHRVRPDRGRDHLAADRGRHRRGFSQHRRGQGDVEATPGFSRADFFSHGLEEVFFPAFEFIGGGLKTSAAFAWTERGPRRKGGGGGRGRCSGFLDGRRHGAGGDGPGQGIDAFECPSRSIGPAGVPHQEVNVEQARPSSPRMGLTPLSTASPSFAPEAGALAMYDSSPFWYFC